MNIKEYFKQFAHIRRQAGFTLLIAALVAAVVLSIASAIFDIAQKQVALASLSQQSQYAFYAADTAAECALYWDVRYNYFAPTTPSLATSSIPQAPVAPPYCGGQSIALAPALSNQSYNLPSCYYAAGAVGNKTLPCYVIPYTQFPTLNLFTTGQHSYCARITITKFLDPTGVVHTLIHADGFNVACSAIPTSQTALERSVELNY